jgi:hypothetical protein
MRELRQCGEKAEVADDSSLIKPQRDDDMPVADRERKSDEHPTEGYSAPVLAGGTVR